MTPVPVAENCYPHFEPCPTHLGAPLVKRFAVEVLGGEGWGGLMKMLAPLEFTSPWGGPRAVAAGWGSFVIDRRAFFTIRITLSGPERPTLPEGE